VYLDSVTREAYLAAQPFPHVVVDNFYDDPDALRAVIAEWPEEAFFKDCPTSRKFALCQPSKFGPATRRVFDMLNSGAFISELERVTGYEGLLADEDLIGGGLHLIPPTGFLKIHADFNWHPKLHATRRLNLLLYLNDNWTENGDLLLCDEEVRPVYAIAPIFNRAVLFNTSDTSYHGHPEPLTGRRARISLALYYYQRTEKPEWTHTTLYKNIQPPLTAPTFV
jgi:Rps23 Pro-64 3,4-dihydroxylase Tpa1-like proline 4-hydroxylase